MTERTMGPAGPSDTDLAPPEGGGPPPFRTDWARQLGPEPEGLTYSFVFRVVTGVVAVVFGTAFLLLAGSLSGWTWQSWMLPMLALEIGLLVLVGEHLRSRAYERQLSSIEESPEKNVEALLLELGHPPRDYRATRRTQQFRRSMKRVFDLMFALMSLSLLAPLFLLVAILIKLDSPGPVLFGTKRVGWRGEIFRLLKFRTIRQDAQMGAYPEMLLELEEGGTLFKSASDARVTRVGRFLRLTSLDELPRLWNVLRGELSLVGPRPLLPEELADLEGSPLLERLEGLKPGVVSAWSVYGSWTIASLEEPVELDVRFHERASLWQEIRLLLAVVPRVLRRGGAV